MLLRYLEQFAFGLFGLVYGAPPTMHIRASQDPGLPPRIDLRTSTCVPPPPLINQQDVPMCAAVAFISALHCSLRRRGLWRLPVSDRLPDAEQLYQHALQGCAVSKKGLTMNCLLQSLQELFGSDLRSLRLAPKQVERHRIRHHLAEGTPLIVGYVSDDRRQSFQASAHEAAAVGHELPSLLQAPSSDERVGHCVILMGYEGERCLARNSAGPDWGLQGHFWIPLHMLEDPLQTQDIWAFVTTA